MNNTFVAHPSVRIKGTENNYNPLQCFDPLCQDKNPHMHCPFCTKNECYTDPVILKAHYRVKHVDKGIDFAGLKVLRCCDQCDIIGVIKGEKKFKGAHWHCYKCKNGFNRRDEAIKHYKTHFRNPQTTFQIQIAQEVNQSVTQGYENDDGTTTIQSEEFSVQSIHPVLTEAITCMTSDEQGFTQTSIPTVIQRNLETSSSMPGVGAVETVGVSDTQTIMIIQEDGSLSALHETTNNSQDGIASDPNSTIDTTPPVEESGMHGKLLIKIHNLENEKIRQQKEIIELRKKVEEQAEQIAEYKVREQDLVEQLNIPTDRNIQELCDQMEAKHKELIQQQLSQLKRTFLHSATPNMIIVNAPINGGLNQQIALQTLSATESDGSQGDVRIHFQTTDPSVESTETVSETQQSSVSEIEESEAHEMKCEIEIEKEPEFEILHQEFTDSIDEDRLQIQDNDIPIENDGQEPPAKRLKEEKCA